MRVEDYAKIARVRARQLPTRIGLGCFLGFSAWALAPSVWPAVWFAAMLAAQLADHAIFQPFTRETPPVLTPWRKAACLTSAALNTAVYSSIAAYMWLRGGEAGEVFAFVQVAGGLLHVALHNHRSRTLLIAAAAPHAMYMFGLPLLAGASDPRANGVPMAIVTIGAGLFVAHLVAAVRQTAQITGALEAAQARAERASEAKSEFLSTVSHEIRTPMNAVISAANLLKRTDLTLEQREHVGMLLNAGDVLMSLLNDVLDLSKIEAGKMTLNLETVDVADRMQALVALWRPRAEVQGVSLRLEQAADVPAHVLGDPLRVQQVLFNLLGNALKFTDAGAVVVRVGRTGDRLWFEVQDTGCGMSAEDLARVFETFEQASTPDLRRGGTGLGLAISRRLAELMRGNLTAVSVEGGGSTFRLDLPLIVATAPVAIAPQIDVGCADGGCLSVLVVEDHAVNQRIVALFLEPLGWRLTQAWNGQEALEACAVERFDVILMDMQMPVMDGIAATGAIRRGGGPNADTPVVALTAAALEHSRQAWAGAGVEAFLTKPIQPEMLIETLAAVASAPAAMAHAEAA